MNLTISKIKTFHSALDIPDINRDSILIYGNNTLDSRSQTISNHCETKVRDIFKIIYNEDHYTFDIQNIKTLDQFSMKSFELGEHFIKTLSYKHIYLDATSLGFAELLLILHYLNDFKVIKNIKVFYVEPDEYKLKPSYDIFTDEFDLSSGFNSFKKIPPYSLLIDSSSSHKARLITLLGFEEDRLSRIIEDDDGARYSHYTPLLALPAFKPGWENISLRKHTRQIKHFDKLEFAPANNPYETYNVLEKIKRNTESKNIVIAPIGTKPHAIGAIIFLINSKAKSENVGVIYDFPVKKEKRTEGIGNIHEYTLSI